MKQFYREVNKSEKILEIIYVTSDNNPDAFKKFFGQMPWKAVPYDNDRKSLKKMHAITTIPCLPLFSRDGKIISANIKSDVQSCENNTQEIRNVISLWNGKDEHEGPALNDTSVSFAKAKPFNGKDFNQRQDEWKRKREESLNTTR